MDLNGPRAHLASIVKRLNSTYHIKTKGHYLDGKTLKLECLPINLLQGGPSRVSSPPTGHPTAYEKFVMDKYINAKNKQKKYLSADFSVSKFPYFSED